MPQLLKPARSSTRVLQLLKPAHLEPLLRNEKPLQWEARAPQQRVAPVHRNEKAHVQPRRPNAAKYKKEKFLNKFPFNPSIIPKVFTSIWGMPAPPQNQNPFL